jgi:oxygen-independent coproporphyrinogen-3 oxidase
MKLSLPTTIGSLPLQNLLLKAIVRRYQLYIHLPFVKVCALLWLQQTHYHEVEHPYIEAIIKEMGLYCKLLNENQL